MISNDEIVIYLIINKDLNMSPGKIAAQVGHACCRYGFEIGLENNKKRLTDVKKIFLSWLENDEKKIILHAHENEIFKILSELQKNDDIEYGIIYDKGYTEVSEDSFTCLYFLPEQKEKLQTIKGFKRLQLLK